MDNYFNQMVELIKTNKSLGQIAIKAEFESEGTRMSELLRLKEIASAAQIPMVVKIGGCEAIRDLLDCKDLRIENLVAPMIESKYAAYKFVQALERVFSLSKLKPNTYINIETHTGFKNLDSIAKEISGHVNGIVMGRVDYVGSINKKRDMVNSKELLNDALSIANVCLENKLEFVIGGGISVDAIPFLSEVNKVNLSRFETRKCVFEASKLKDIEISTGLKNAVLFELLWLKSKQSYNSMITEEDNVRIKMLEKRHIYNASSCS